MAEGDLGIGRAQPESVKWYCPECKQGKLLNCARDAWDNDNDCQVICATYMEAMAGTATGVGTEEPAPDILKTVTYVRSSPGGQVSMWEGKAFKDVIAELEKRMLDDPVRSREYEVIECEVVNRATLKPSVSIVHQEG